MGQKLVKIPMAAGATANGTFAGVSALDQKHALDIATAKAMIVEMQVTVAGTTTAAPTLLVSMDGVNFTTLGPKLLAIDGSAPAAMTATGTFLFFVQMDLLVAMFRAVKVVVATVTGSTFNCNVWILTDDN